MLKGVLLFRPMVKIVGNIHGDESVGREMIIGRFGYLEVTAALS